MLGPLPDSRLPHAGDYATLRLVPCVQPITYLGGTALSEDSRPATFSNVALTLISLVIALGVEHLLEHVSLRISEADSTTSVLVVAQGVATFLTIGVIWISYASQLMTAAWKPQFQDFLNPLFFLSLLYFWISAIGAGGPSWFYLSTVASAIALYGHSFGLPKAVALRLVPSSAGARPFLLSQLGLFLLAGGGGIATHVGALSAIGATIPISLMAVVQLLSGWFLFQWWRAA
jgi:hypothetical protein